jgi:hypothetical protein
MHPAARRLSSTLLVAVTTLTACDFPTQLPRYDTFWDVVAVRDSIATADLLPEHLRVAPEGFVIDSFSTEGEVRLRDVCELCTCFQGPIPAFEITPHDWQIPLPAGVVSATLERGSAHIVIHNQVGFDILNDGGGNEGFLLVDLVDTRQDDKIIQRVVLADRFPPGDSLSLSFDLARVALSTTLVARVSGYMPGSGCQEVALTPESGFRTRVELDDVVASSVEVWVSNAALRLRERTFALPSLIARRLRAGEAHLTVEVDVGTRLPADVEIGVSAAGRREDLFTQRAALYTPLLIPGGAPASPNAVHKLYVVQVDPLHEADSLFLDTRNRFLVQRPMLLRGGEAVSYQIRLKAEIPSR